MKKSLLSATFLLFSFLSVFAQEEEQHSAEYNWGEKNAVWVIIGLVVVIILIVWAVRRKKK